jgi:hypothetical protein
MALFEELAAAGAPKYSSAALENSKIVVAHQAIFFGCDGRNTDGSNAIWIMVFDSATLPANGSLPVLCIGVPPAGSGATAANGNFGYNASSSWGIRFTKGIVIAVSTSDATLTLSASSKTLLHVDYASEDGVSID